MKRVLPLLLLGLLSGSANVLFAQESADSELELVRQLRLKGWNDLAKIKIDSLAKSTDPALQAALPLELARSNIALARQKDAEQRATLFTTARGQLQEYINRNPGKVQAAFASAELARLSAYHGQALLTKALREEDNRSRHDKARPAEAMFLQAAKDLGSAEEALKQALQNPANAALKSSLEVELRQVRFDKATNLFDQARTYIDKSKDAVNAARSNTMAKAKTAFTALRKESTPIGWLANAWLMKCAMELDAPDEVNTFYENLLKTKDQTNAGPAVRLAKFFHMQDLTPPRPDELEAIGRNPKYSKMKPVDRLHAVQKEGENWLKTYPSFRKSQEGQGVLYELAMAYLLEGQFERDKMEKEKTDKAAKEKQKVLSDAHFAKASKHFDELASLDGDRSDRARQISMSLKFQTLDVKTEPNTFEECLMKAMLQREKVRALNAKLDQAPPAEQKKLEGERKQHLKDVIKSLDKAMALATSKTPLQKIDDARSLLSGAYLASNDPYRAAVVAEALGRARPPTRKSPEGAALAIQTYAALQSRQPDNVAIRTRLEDLAKYVLSEEIARTWGADPVTSLAHYHLGMAQKRDGNIKEALKHLEKIAPDFVDFNYTQGQIVFIAEAAREKAADKKEQVEWIKAAKSAINRMVKLNVKEDSSSVIAMTFFAKMEMAKFLYAEAIEDLNAKKEAQAIKKCHEMAKYIKDLLAQFDQVPPGKLSSENHDQLQFSMNVMLKYSDLGVAEVKFRGTSPTRFDEVIAATNNVVNQVLARAKSVPANQPIRMKDYRVTGDILGLALRANVQKGDVIKGRLILDVLKRLTGPDGASSSGNVVALLLNDIAGQIKTMKETKDQNLQITKGNYTSFLDEIAKEFEARGYDNSAATMIGHAFVSLDFPAKAVQAYSKVKAPVSLDKKIDKKQVKETDEELKSRQQWEDEVRQYWGMQLEYVRALRGCKDKDSVKTAEKVVDTMLKHPNSRFQVQAMMERNLILEDQERYKEAYIDWSQRFMKNSSLLKDLGNKDVQKVYFAGYFYMTRTLFKMAVHDPLIKDKQKFITGAANMILKLEFANTKDGWNVVAPMYDELLKAEPRLKEEYDRLKAQRPKVP
jgi:hypothetical protein